MMKPGTPSAPGGGTGFALLELSRFASLGGVGFWDTPAGTCGAGWERMMNPGTPSIGFCDTSGLPLVSGFTAFALRGFGTACCWSDGDNGGLETVPVLGTPTGGIGGRVALLGLSVLASFGLS
jgi:hypothetical protein